MHTALFSVLTDVIKAIDEIKDENIDYGDLNTCLQNLGVYLSKPEFQKITELTEVGGKWHIFRKTGLIHLKRGSVCYSFLQGDDFTVFIGKKVH